MSIRIFAPAKINISLKILGRRDDGYHQIDTVMQTIGLCDHIDLARGNGIQLLAPPHLPEDRGNLCYRAAEIFYQRLNVAPEVKIELAKHIPVQAGLGGGSSNAAAVLVGLNKLYDNPFTKIELTDLAATLGSDVPFFIFGGTARATGRGEYIQPLPDGEPWWLRIIKPPFGLSTADVYAQWHNTDRPSHIESLNDLEAPALKLRPELALIRQAMLKNGANHVLLCGSGSAVCGFYRTRPNQLLSLSPQHQEFVTRTISRQEFNNAIMGRECAV